MIDNVNNLGMYFNPKGKPYKYTFCNISDKNPFRIYVNLNKSPRSNEIVMDQIVWC